MRMTSSVSRTPGIELFRLLVLPWTSCICWRAISYVSLYPVRAGLVGSAADGVGRACEPIWRGKAMTW